MNLVVCPASNYLRLLRCNVRIPLRLGLRNRV